MKKYIILVILFFSTIVQAQIQIDSIQFIGTTADSLEFIVHYSKLGGCLVEDTVEYEEGESNIEVNIFSTDVAPLATCYRRIQTIIKIKKDIYQKAIVSIMMRYPIGGTEENPEYSIYQIRDSKEIDLLNFTSLEIYDIQGSLLLSKNITSEKGIDVSFLPSGLYAVLIDRKYIGNIIKK